LFDWSYVSPSVDAAGRFFIIDKKRLWVFGCPIGQTVSADGTRCVTNCLSGYEMINNACVQLDVTISEPTAAAGALTWSAAVALVGAALVVLLL
jgi:hypothetical protein